MTSFFFFHFCVSGVWLEWVGFGLIHFTHHGGCQISFLLSGLIVDSPLLLLLLLPLDTNTTTTTTTNPFLAILWLMPT
ncbi:hypothetical protein F4809DRAFT_630890 [Biscogniauxia mediterranea]|nr:hypothetical protein F4809DRAFT_630890 [Biscogniauxia mediterranea]